MKTKNALGDLAAELAKSQGRRNAAVEAAEAKHASVRADVIDRGTARIVQISALADELRKEQNALKAVLADA